MQTPDRKPVSRKQRERDERYRFTQYRPPEPKVKQDKQQNEPND